MTWTVERIEHLKKLWEAGLSARHICAELGTTRNAVLGKVNRLGLDLRKPTRSHPFRAHKLKYEQIISQADPGAPLHIQFANLKMHHCRYPYGGDLAPLTFCGRERQNGSSYCADHHALCWYASPEQKQTRKSSRYAP
jgi:GcrA cell cycle regulator